MFQNDYIMREIERLTRMLGMILMGRQVEQGEINEAENLLFEYLDNDARHSLLDVAIRFYNHLNKLDDERLEQCDYSREEIADGLRAVEKYYLRV